MTFLNNTGVREARLVPADMLRLSVDSVGLAEASIVAASAAAAAAPPPPLVSLRVPPRALLRPTDAGVHLGGISTTHAPGEHVVYVRSSGTVPFGERGIVVAVQGTQCEVLFEREGYCGTGHFAQLHSCRGAVLPASALLNLTKPLPAAYRLSTTSGERLRSSAAAMPSGGGGGVVSSSATAALARRAVGGIPANIWSLLEDLEPEIREPEYVPGAEKQVASGGGLLGGGAASAAERRAGGKPAKKKGGRAANIYREGADFEGLDLADFE